MNQIVMSIIKKEVELKKFKIEVGEKFLLNLNKNNYLGQEKEYFSCILTYYNFLFDVEASSLVNKFYNLFKEDEEKFLNNLGLNNIRFFSNNEEVMNISIIIFKSMTEVSLISEDYYGKTKNSDKVLDSCVKQFENYLIFYNLSFREKRQIRTIFFKFIEHLVFNKLIVEKKIYDKSSYIYKSIKMWGIEGNFINLIPTFNLLYYPCSIIKYKNKTYLKGEHHSRVYLLCVENFNSGDAFEIKDLNYLKRTVENKLYFDIETVGWLKKIIEDEHQTSIPLLKKQITELSYEIKLKFMNNNWSEETKEDISSIQRLYSKKIELLLILIFLDNDVKEEEPLYLVPFYDFRGRKYIDSVIGPTSSKLSRFLFHYGWYKDEDFKDNLEIQRIDFFKDKIKSFCSRNGINYQDKYLSIIFWILIGIGKHLIDKAKVFIDDTLFIDKGVYIYEEGIDTLKLKFIDRVEILYYFTILKDLNKKQIKKKIIMKDATASVYQVAMTILKPKDQKSLDCVNMGESNYYVDTYSLQIKLFIENLSKKDKRDFGHHLHLIKRSIIKKTAMTIPYSAGFDRCYDDFKKKIIESGVSYSFDKDVEKMYNKYYNFIKYKMERLYLYKTSSKDLYEGIIEEFEKKREYYRESETGKASLRYYKLKSLSIDVNISLVKDGITYKKRLTKLIKALTTSIDINKTRVSIGANVMHFADGDVLRDIENEMETSFLTIHDCILVDINSCSKLINTVNKVYQKKIDSICGEGLYKVNSIFIIV